LSKENENRLEINDKQDVIKPYQTLKIAPLEKWQITQVLEIACECGLSFWSFKDFEEETEKAGGFVKAARINEETVGFIVARPTFEIKSDVFGKASDSEIQLEIYNIAVKKQFRRKGIGQRILQDLLAYAALYRRAVLWLEVRQSNEKAIKFYGANNFEIAYRRKNFYRHPNEDAFVMKLEIG